MPTWFVEDPSKSMPPPSTSGAHLTLLSESIDTTALTAQVGMTPDEAWERGERPNAAGKFAGITFRSNLSDAAAPGNHLDALLERLAPVTAQIAAAAADDGLIVRLWLVHRVENWNPGLSLSGDLIRRIDALGAGIEVDIYVLEASDIVAQSE
jgi:hypothetical protein